jgi:microcystin-dependent protein
MKNIFFFLFLSTSTWAQVGFNNPNPHPKSILDLTATDKGLLIPRMSQSLREALFPASDPTGEGMMVYQTDNVRGLYYYNGNSWFLLNEWVKNAGSSNVTSTGDVIVAGTLTTSNTNNAGVLTTATLNSSNINTTTTSSTNVSTSNLTVPGFAANALVPTGVIVMWSGTVPPAGWALCDGLGGRPDLRGRFIAGYHPGDFDYNTIGKVGGAKTHLLTISEMPSHAHQLPVDGLGATTDRQSLVSSANADEGFPPSPVQPDFTANQGGNQPHENRPPYYTLAYIIKL